MSKERIDVVINGATQDCVINHYMKEKRDKDNAVIWVDEKEGIVKTSGRVFKITVYISDKEDNKKASVIEIQPESVKTLYNKIMEIEQLEGEDYND